MSPKKTNTENKGLPERWRFKHNAYYFRVPINSRGKWDNKTEFRLGTTLSDAYKVYSDMIEIPDSVRSMASLIDRYQLEILTSKAIQTQRDERRYLVLLKAVFGDSPVESVTPQDCYRLRDELTRKRGATTSNRVIGLLSHIFTKSIEWGARADHPIIGKVKKNKIIVQRRIPEYWEIDEALKVAQPMMQCYVELKLMTALRMTDMLSIKLSDLREDGIHVRPIKTAYSSGKQLIIQWDHENRLKNVIDKTKSLPGPISSIWLFRTRKGQPYIKSDKSCNAFQSMWKRWQDKALRGTKLQDRFSEKSLRNRTGSDVESAEKASELLGHSSTDTTKRHYRNAPDRVSPFVKKL